MHPADLRVMKAGQHHNPVADPGENEINPGYQLRTAEIR